MTHPPRARSSRLCAFLRAGERRLRLSARFPSRGSRNERPRNFAAAADARGRRGAAGAAGGRQHPGPEDDALSRMTAVGASDAPRQVNGMGTGTIVDERGYILTNYHVVSDVRRIEVTLDDGRGYTAELVAYDAAADLAVIKIPAAKPLPVIRIGTSADLMEGESVIALGNAFGYEQTVTRGIISALGRDVQVSDTQAYDDLIQTDASINPGNSGGPLLNIDGEMIGVNVAVRAGAQGIGFAIPIDSALNVAARLLNVSGCETSGTAWSRKPATSSTARSASPKSNRPARPKSWAFSRATRSSRRHAADRAAARSGAGVLDRPAGEPVPVEVRRDGQTMTLDLALAESRVAHDRGATRCSSDDDAKVWDVLGLKLTEEPRARSSAATRATAAACTSKTCGRTAPPPRKAFCPATSWSACTDGKRPPSRTSSTSSRGPTLTEMGKLKFYVLRGQNTLYGHLNVAAQATRRATRSMSRLHSRPHRCESVHLPTRCTRCIPGHDGRAMLASRLPALQWEAWNSSSSAGCASTCRLIRARRSA